DALKLIDKNLVVNIYGNETGEYYDRIKKEAGELAVFRGDVPNYKTPEIYNQHEIFVNLTNSGSLDKTIFEAMACGCLAIVSNKSFLKIFPTQLTKLLIFKENDSKDLANKIINLNNLSDDKKEEIRKILIGIVKNEHSLNKLRDDLSGIISIYEDKR
ncbi:glycosyltransferase, partial [Patescibacteria group bacterium]|nr:glycosyltransferase [Patescibacteria group bacterium]